MADIPIQAKTISLSEVGTSWEHSYETESTGQLCLTGIGELEKRET